MVYYFPPRITTRTVSSRHTISGSKRLLFPSRIVARKGIETCLEAMAKLPQEFTLSLPALFPMSRVDATYYKKIINLISALSLKDRIIFPKEIVTPEKMFRYYQDADIVLVPSEYEGFGIVAVEAMKWGLPVVASNVGGLAEIITDGVDGLLIEPRNADSIVEAVLRLARDKRLALQLAKQAKITVRDRFSLERHMNRIEEIYSHAQR